jgi:hypothetical protein
MQYMRLTNLLFLRMHCLASMVYAGSRLISSIPRCSMGSFPVSHHTLLFDDADNGPIKTRPTLFREDLDSLWPKQGLRLRTLRLAWRFYARKIRWRFLHFAA